MAGLIDMFSMNLEEMYAIEKGLVETLAELSESSTDEDVKESFDKHLEETEEHVNKIEEIFGLLNISPSHRVSQPLSGLQKERENVVKQGLNTEALDMANLNAAIKSERLEMSNYENLILLAKELDLENKEDIIALLKENLKDEENALSKAQAALKSHVPLMKRMMY